MSSTLSQDEISAILEGLRSNAIGVNERGPDEPPANEPDKQIKRFDLTASQERLFTGRLPGLEMIFERFSRALRVTLANRLGRPVVVAAGSIETVKYGIYCKRLPLPSSLHIFRMPPLPGHALLTISTPLAFALVELLMGGNTTRAVKTQGREFSSIETRLIGKIVASILGDFEQAWSAVEPVQCVYVRSELNPLALSLVPPTDTVALGRVEVGVEQVSAELDVCIPSFTLQPVRDRLSSTVQRANRDVDQSSAKRISEHLANTPVEVRALLAQGSIRVRDLLDLKVGDVLPLSTPFDAPTRVLVEGVEKFIGSVGQSRGNKAVRIG